MLSTTQEVTAGGGKAKLKLPSDSFWVRGQTATFLIATRETFWHCSKRSGTLFFSPRHIKSTLSHFQKQHIIRWATVLKIT